MNNSFSKAVFLSSVTISLSLSGMAQAKSTVHVDNISARCHSILNETNALCVDQQNDGKFYVTHFQNGKPVKQFLVSPGKVHSDGTGTFTPRGIFSIDRKHRNQPTYYGGYLPYASHISTNVGKNGIYFHVGQTTGNFASHGCLRSTNEGAKYIFNTIPMHTKVAIDNTRPKK